MRTFLILLCLGALLRATETNSPYPVGEKAAAIEKRVEALLGKLTQEEKISLLAGDGFEGMSTIAISRLGIPKLVMADGPQ